MDRQFTDWRDHRSPSSPLTPKTPSTKQVFNFDNTSPDSAAPSAFFGGLKPSLLDVPRPPILRMDSSYIHTSRNFSENFMRLRSVFSPNARRKINENTL